MGFAWHAKSPFLSITGDGMFRRNVKTRGGAQ